MIEWRITEKYRFLKFNKRTSVLISLRPIFSSRSSTKNGIPLGEFCALDTGYYFTIRFNNKKDIS